MQRHLLVLGLLLLAGGEASAHDYWLLPDTFFPKAGDAVALHLHVSDHYGSEAERPFSRKSISRFQMHTARDSWDLAKDAKDGQVPVGTVKTAAGTQLIALERPWVPITLDADKFNAYLKEEGLDDVLEQRCKAGRDKEPGRECYSRYLKCLIQTGAKTDDCYRKNLGHRLEIIPEAHPATLKAGDKLAVKILFDGQPLAGVQVSAYHRSEGKLTAVTERTTKEGLATFKLEKSGPWLVRLVHMRPCVEPEVADWESFWAAYSFAVRE